MRAKRLANLLERGRRLHWQNARTLASTRLRTSLPERIGFRADLVYRTIQLVGAIRFVEARGYLEGGALDAFLEALHDEVAGEDSVRIDRMLEVYAGAFHDERRFAEVVTTDLSHALFGKARPEARAALAQTPAAVLKTTCLYCAEVFGDAAALRALG